jgi:transposase, IS6 family
VSARTVLAWVHSFGPLLATEAQRHAPPVGQCWYVDETYIRASGRWMYLYRAVDAHGQVIDVLLRAQRNLAGARALFAQALARRGVRPSLVATDKHPAYRRAIRRQARGARPVRTGLHRARGQTTKAIERWPVPLKDRLRPMRGLQPVRTGQRGIEAVEAMQAPRRGIRPGEGPASLSAHERARAVAERVGQCAAGLRSPTQ